MKPESKQVVVRGDRVVRAVAVPPDDRVADQHLDLARREAPPGIDTSRDAAASAAVAGPPATAAAHASSATRPQKPRPGSPRDPVDADHPLHHVTLDVAVVEPRARVLLAPADPEALGRADRGRVDVGAVRAPASGGRARGRCGESSPSVSTSHWTRSPTLAWKTGVLPTNARPLIVLKSSVVSRKTTNSLVGRLLARAEDRERAVEAAGDRLVHRRRVVVVRPDADRVGAGDEPVGERLPRLRRSRPAGEARDVGAVGARPVVDAVEVHRVRLVVERVEVLEVDEDVSPTFAWISGPWIPRSPSSFGIGFAQPFVNWR